MEVKMEKQMTQKYLLRKWREGDEDSIVKYANNTEVSKFLKDSFPSPYTYSDALRWVRFSNRSVDAYHVAIVVGENAVGCIGVEKQQDVYCKSAELGYWLGQEYWNQGIMTDVVRQMVDIAFDKMDIVRLYAYVFSGNIASSKVLEKAGFILESRQVAAVYKNGKHMDQLVYSIVRM